VAWDRDSRETPENQAMLARIQAATSDMTQSDIQDVLQRLLAARMPLAAMFEQAPPSRRRPRRSDVVSYRVRIDLKGTRPPLWRRLELASDLFLDQVHEIIQVAFGWTDSHLHQFASGPGHYGPETEHYLCPFQVEEGDTGIPEEDVRLDEVLADSGDKLFYDYDFGDGWEHVVKLEAVLPRQNSGPRAVCVAGRRDGPAEDCGGVYAYELICAASDPGNPDHADAVAEFDRFYGASVDPEDIRTTPFDINEINDILAGLNSLSQDDPADRGAGQERSYPGPLAELLHAVGTTAGKRELRQLISKAHLNQPVHIDAGTAARMVRPYAWLLNSVGDDGIRLTGAGYLPPAHVEAAMAELDLGEEWIGKGNRENQTLPVLHLRESAAKMGLLRKRRGMLLLTSRARELRANPVALWWHLAERMPPKSSDQCETQAGLILLAVLAGQAADDPDAIVARLLAAIGWVKGDGTELDDLTAAHASWDTKTALRRLGALADDGRRLAEPRPDGVTFARAALRSWPQADHPTG
jgi:Plasmid pRiA4b ORF-3-like protein